MHEIGLVSLIADLIQRRTHVRAFFAYLIAAAIVAVPIMPYVVVTTAKGEIIPNVFSIIIGGSGVSNKTVALNIARDIVGRLENRISTTLLLPDKFTTEALTTYFTERSNDTERVGIIIGDELSRMFTDLRKDWLTGVIEYLSKLYDGWILSSLTIIRGAEGGVKAFVCFLSGSTYVILKMLTDDLFIQGTVGRILWVVDTTLIEDSKNPFDTDDSIYSYNQEINDIVDRLAALFKHTTELTERGKYVLPIDSDAQELLGEYFVNTQRRARQAFNENPFNPLVGTVARLGENATKLAMIHCMGRFASGTPKMELIDVEWAINKVELSLIECQKLLTIKEQMNPKKVTRAALQRVERESWIRDMTRQNGQVTTAEFSEKFGIVSDGARKFFNRLVDDGKMSKEVRGHKTVIWRWKL